MAKESAKRYIRLITKGEDWTGMVAELIKEFEAGPSKTKMYSFYDARGNTRCITHDEVEIITQKEYFRDKLKGIEVFNDKPF